MEKNNGGKVIAVVALVVAVVALSIGFAAYSVNLTIEGNATIKASDQFSANVVYDEISEYAPKCYLTSDSTNKTSIITTGYSAGNITNSGHSWTGINVPLNYDTSTTSYPSVTCEAYVKNESAYIAYLTALRSESSYTCASVSSGADAASNESAICGATTVTVYIDSESITLSSSATSNLANPSGTIAAKNGTTVSRIPVKVVIANSSTVAADGDIRVTLPTITHSYSTTR